MQSAFKGFYAVTLIALLATCFVIGVYALVYWSVTQNVEQTITSYGTASAVSTVTLPPAESAESGVYNKSGAVTVNIGKAAGLYLKWTKGSTTPADLTTVYSTLIVHVKEGATLIVPLNLLQAGPWQTPSAITGSHTYDYSITYTIQTDAPDVSVVIPLTVELVE